MLRTERKRTNSQVPFFIRTLIRSDQGPTLKTSFNLNYFQKASSLNTVAEQLGIQHMNFGGKTFQFIALHDQLWAPYVLILAPRATGQPLLWILPVTVAEGMRSLEGFPLAIKYSGPEVEVCLKIYWLELVTWPHPIIRESEGTILAYSQKVKSWKYLVNSINDYHRKNKWLLMNLAGSLA